MPNESRRLRELGPPRAPASEALFSAPLVQGQVRVRSACGGEQIFRHIDGGRRISAQAGAAVHPGGGGGGGEVIEVADDVSRVARRSRDRSDAARRLRDESLLAQARN